MDKISYSKDYPNLENDLKVIQVYRTKRRIVNQLNLLQRRACPFMLGHSYVYSFIDRPHQ